MLRNSNNTSFDQLLEMMEDALAKWYQGEVVELPLREPDAILILAREIKRMQGEVR